MGLRKQSVDDLSMLVDLNDNEKESIKRYNQGDALFVCGDAVVTLPRADGNAR